MSFFRLQWDGIWQDATDFSEILATKFQIFSASCDRKNGEFINSATHSWN